MATLEIISAPYNEINVFTLQLHQNSEYSANYTQRFLIASLIFFLQYWGSCKYFALLSLGFLSLIAWLPLFNHLASSVNFHGGEHSAW
jgi:hypothetical protein